MSSKGWIGVDLDGTLAQYDSWIAPTHIGEPVPAMLERVKGWLAEGKEVRIFTARVYPLLYVKAGVEPSKWQLPDTGVAASQQRLREASEAATAIQLWCLEHLDTALDITCVKDYGMVELWDDRAVQVVKNTGIPVGEGAAKTSLTYLVAALRLRMGGRAEFTVAEVEDLSRANDGYITWREDRQGAKFIVEWKDAE